jgi:hypothetical protein
MPPVTSGIRIIAVMFAAAAALVSAGCHEDMYQQQKYKTYTVNPFFPDSLSERQLPAGVVVHTKQPEDELLATGMINGRAVDTFPFPVTKEVLLRGKDRFNNFCTPCHGTTGDGNGMIVQRGFPAPPSYHTDSVRVMPAGFYVDVMTRGFGRMYPFAARIHPKDRWAIAAYIRVLQYSRHASVAGLPDDQRKRIDHQ